ncbi:hypothetical protein NQ318_003013 [Aromia moschata]|uniref:Uncharacterized protein n=1 Tax=Aromia moschata TaxID=1265417 RepID=A0AAV8YQH7_9CUCU|nr:hypothetical protein NQ318_003013 [Aromia moschata]
MFGSEGESFDRERRHYRSHCRTSRKIGA